MRFLKNKIIKAQEAQKKKLASLVAYEELDFVNTVKLEEPAFIKIEAYSPSYSQQNFSSVSTSLSCYQPEEPTRKTVKENSQSPKTRHSRPTKNISINYGKAIASFAVSNLALPYIQDLLIQHHMTHKEFKNFIGNAKDSIGGIESFKNLLQISDNDDYKVKIYKKLFKIASEVFIKYFSVNWIIHGKVANKLVYLQFRGKMLRRVQNPEAFTYIKKRVNKTSKTTKA